MFKRSFWLSVLMYGGMAYASGDLSSALQNLVQKTDPNMNLGMMVVDLTTGTTLYERQAQQTFIPASNMKLFSEAVAMLALGPEYHISQTLSTDASSIHDGRLNGSLYFRLPPDPSFNHQAMFAMLEQLKKWGIKEINGDVVLQSDLAIVPPYAPGMTPKDQQYSYGAPVGPVIIDENRLTITTNPASQVGQPAVIETSSPAGVFTIDNHVMTKASAKGCGVGAVFDELGVVHVHGCVGVGQMAVQQRMPVRHPTAYFDRHVKYQLNHLGIQWNGHLRYGQMPSKTIMVARHISPPLKDLMAATLKPSDNLYANSLYLLAANHIAHQPTNWSNAPTITRDYLQRQTGIEMRSAMFSDGSGLSRYNRVTPYQTMSLLTFLYNKFPLAFEYISALPISGQDGTLQRRLNHPNQKGLVRAKTGTMTGILSLSGYTLSANGHTLAFTIYINTRKGTQPKYSGRYRGFIDAACTLMLQSKPSNRHHALFKNYLKHAAQYQRPPTAIEYARAQQAYWRNLEILLKRQLNMLPVTVVYHPQELIILDRGANDALIWKAIHQLQVQKHFGVMVESQRAPNIGSDAGFLWMQNTPESALVRRWIIRPTGA